MGTVNCMYNKEDKMKTIKKFISIILCAVLAFTAIPMAAFAEEEREIVASGVCGAQGDNLTWTLYDDGEIVIRGEGEMKFYHITPKAVENSTELVPPWYDYFEDIRVITVEEGVTGIGDDAFHFYPRQYYRVNLPKSLEYYYFGSFTATHADNTNLACCYAGSAADWKKVEKRSWTGLRLNEENSEVLEIKYRDPSYGWGISDNASDDEYFDGEEPEIYCVIQRHDSMHYGPLEKGDTVGLHATYYKGEHTDAKLVWKTQGDACTREITKYSASGAPIEAEITAVTHGEFTVTAELVAPDGTVLCSDSETYSSYVREDMTFREKAEEFFKELIGMGAWYAYMIRLLTLLIGMSIFG